MTFAKPNGFFHVLLSAFVIAAIAVPAPLFAAEPGKGDAVTGLNTGLGTGDTAIHRAPEADPNAADIARVSDLVKAGGPAPQPDDVFEHLGQLLRVYGDDGVTVVAEHPFDGKIRTFDPVVVSSWRMQITVVYDPERQELRLDRTESKKGGKVVRTHSHVFTGVNLTNDQARPVLIDPALTTVYLARSTGVRCLYLPVAQALAFKLNIPTFAIGKPVHELEPGAKILSMEFVTPAGPQPVVMQTLDGNLASEFVALSLRLNVQMPDGTVIPLYRSLREILEFDIPAQLKKYLLSILAAAPSLENVGLVAEVLQTFADEGARAEGVREQILDGESSDPGSDLQLNILQQVGAVLNLGRYAALVDERSGPSPFQRTARGRMHEFSLAEWQEQGPMLARVKEAEERLGLEVRPWSQVLLDEARDPSKNTLVGMARAAEAQKKALRDSKNKIRNIAIKMASKKNVQALVLALGADWANYASGGEVSRWMLFLLGKMFAWTEHVPIVKELAHEFARGAPFFETKFAFTTVLIGTAAMLSLRPIFYAVAQAVAFAKGERNADGSVMTKEEAFFTLGMRAYPKINYPLAKPFWEKLLGQKVIYRALQNGVSPLSPKAWHWGRSEEAVQAANERLDEHLVERGERNARALLVALCYVSEKSRAEGRPTDPGMLLALMQAHDQGQFERFNKLLATMPPDAALQELTLRVQRALWKTSDKGIGTDLDIRLAKEYVARLDPIVEKFYRTNARTDAGIRVRRWVAKKWRKFARWTSKSVMPYMLFQEPQYRELILFKGMNLSQRNVDTAKHHYDADYISSTITYGVADASLTGQMVALSPAAIIEMMMNQVQQVLFFGPQLAYDNLMLNGKTEDVSGGQTPLVLAQLDRGNSSAEGAREQTFLEATTAVVGEILDPDAKRGLLQTQRIRMENVIKGFQVRLLLGAVPRVIGLAALALIAGEGLGVLPDKAWEGVLKETTTLLGKFSIGYLAAAVTFGYVVIFTPVMFGVNVAKDRAEAGKEKMDQVDYLFDLGLRLDRREQLEQAITQLQALYREQKADVPIEFQQPAENFDDDLANRFWAYSQTKGQVPVITTDSHAFKKNANLIAALVSTGFFLTNSHLMWNPKLAIGPQLAQSGLNFILTYGAVAMGLQVVGPSILRAGRWAVKKTTGWCGRRLSSLRFWGGAESPHHEEVNEFDFPGRE